jgi:hypothetical protein
MNTCPSCVSPACGVEDAELEDFGGEDEFLASLSGGAAGFETGGWRSCSDLSVCAGWLFAAAEDGVFA